VVGGGEDAGSKIDRGLNLSPTGGSGHDCHGFIGRLFPPEFLDLVGARRRLCPRDVAWCLVVIPKRNPEEWSERIEEREDEGVYGDSEGVCVGGETFN
jgi:hypothetical protein